MSDNIQNILILEDNRDDVVLIKRQVKKAYPDATFSVAEDRQAFLKKSNWITPSLILSDYNLPDYNGLEALLYCRENLPTVPFVFVTGALDNQESAAEAILNGAAGYILKDNIRVLPTKLPEIVERFRDQNSTIEIMRTQLNRVRLLAQKIESKAATGDSEAVLPLIKKLRAILSE